MSEKREQLLDLVISVYGFEHQMTISFAQMCEKWVGDEQWDKLLELWAKGLKYGLD